MKRYIKSLGLSVALLVGMHIVPSQALAIYTPTDNKCQNACFETYCGCVADQGFSCCAVNNQYKSCMSACSSTQSDVQPSAAPAQPNAAAQPNVGAEPHRPQLNAEPQR